MSKSFCCLPSLKTKKKDKKDSKEKQTQSFVAREGFVSNNAWTQTSMSFTDYKSRKSSSILSKTPVSHNSIIVQRKNDAFAPIKQSKNNVKPSEISKLQENSFNAEKDNSSFVSRSFFDDIFTENKETDEKKSSDEEFEHKKKIKNSDKNAPEGKKMPKILPLTPFLRKKGITKLSLKFTTKQLSNVNPCFASLANNKI